MNFREAGREAQGGAAVATQQAVVAPEDAPSPAAPEQVQVICKARQQRRNFLYGKRNSAVQRHLCFLLPLVLKLCVCAGMQSVFNWFKNWYPVAIADDLDPLKPFATKLLGARMFPSSAAGHTKVKSSCHLACSFCLLNARRQRLAAKCVVCALLVHARLSINLPDRVLFGTPKMYKRAGGCMGGLPYRCLRL